MQDRGLFKTMRGLYAPAIWGGKNESGWDPTGAMVLVLPDKAAVKSAGGILTTDESQERQTMAAEAGVLVALGPTAFAWADRERTTRWEGKKPQVGDRVCFQRYSGVHVHGDDGETYSTMNDFCIGAVRSAPSFAGLAILKKPGGAFPNSLDGRDQTEDGMALKSQPIKRGNGARGAK